jgi:phospholipase C
VAGSVAACSLGTTLALATPSHRTARSRAHTATASPIKHVVVIFQENVSFDHYFGTYPYAANTSGQPFRGARGAHVNGLYNTPGLGGHGPLLTNNPNRDASGNQVNPRRLDPSNINDVLMCDQDHDYNDEQKAFDGGLMDKFITTVGTSSGTSGTGQACKPSDVMNYYDGNTVTGMWNYAKHFAMSDDFFGTTFGPSSPGAINLVSGNTGNVGLQDQRREHRRRHRQRRSRRLLAGLRRSALLRRLLHPRRRLDDRHQHRRRAQPRRRELGLVPGRAQADHELRAGHGRHPAHRHLHAR